MGAERGRRSTICCKSSSKGKGCQGEPCTSRHPSSGTEGAAQAGRNLNPTSLLQSPDGESQPSWLLARICRFQQDMGSNKRHQQGF